MSSPETGWKSKGYIRVQAEGKGRNRHVGRERGGGGGEREERRNKVQVP